MLQAAFLKLKASSTVYLRILLYCIQMNQSQYITLFPLNGQIGSISHYMPYPKAVFCRSCQTEPRSSATAISQALGLIKIFPASEKCSS